MYTVGDRFFGRLIFRTCLLTRTCYQHQDNQRLEGTFTFSHCPIFRRFSRSLKGVLKGVLSTLNEQAQSLDWVVSVICAKYIFTCSGMLTLSLQSLLPRSHLCCVFFGSAVFRHVRHRFSHVRHEAEILQLDGFCFVCNQL